MNTPKASIIIPAYNEELYLGNLLEDIASSEYDDYETIVVNNSSKDKTRDVALGYVEKLNPLSVVDESVKGISKARNRGASEAKGEYLLFLDADMRLPKDFVKDSVIEMEKRGVDIGNHYLLPYQGTLFDKAMFTMMNNLLLRPIQYILPSAPGGGGIVIRKSIHDKIGGFDENIKTIAEDVDYEKRGSKQGRFRMLEDSVAYVSMRRFDEEGRVKLWSVWLKAYMYHTLGINTNGIRYDF